MDERSRRLDEVTLGIEELGIRHKIGEVDLNTYAQKAEKLKIEERELRETVKSLRSNLDRLGKMFAERKPREVHNLETQLKTYSDVLEAKVRETKSLQMSGILSSQILMKCLYSLILSQAAERKKKENLKNN